MALPSGVCGHEGREQDGLRETKVELLDIEAAARRAALVEVLRARPETSLAELCSTGGEAGDWLRSSTIIDLAVAALDAGVDRSTQAPVGDDKLPHRATTTPREPTPRADQLSLHLEPTAPEDPRPEPKTASAARSAADAEASPISAPSTWSTSASSLSLAVAPVASARTTIDDDRPAAEPAEDDAGSAEPVVEADIIAALRAAPAHGLAIAELEAAVGGARSRVRRLLRQLEADGVVHREGTARWTRYHLRADGEPDPAPVATDCTIHSVPIRRRRGDVEGVRILYYRSHGGADPTRVAAIVLRDHAITIEYADGQRPFDALERIMTAGGIVTPGDGLRYWTALETAFSTSSHFFVSSDQN